MRFSSRKPLHLWWSVGFCLLLCVSFPVAAARPQQLLYAVLVNAEMRGLINILVTDDHDVLVAQDDMLVWEMRALPPTAALSQNGYVSLRSLQPTVQFRLDAEQETLVVTISPAWLAPREHVYTVLVNMEKKGVFVVLETADQDVLVLPDDWNSWHICPLPQKVVLMKENDMLYVSLNSLHPGVRYTSDQTSATLRITVEPTWFQEVQRIDFASKAPAEVQPIRANALTVNYHVLHASQETGHTLNLPVEARVNLWDYLGEFGVSYMHPADGAAEVVRMSSTITRDDPASLRRYTLGDGLATSGELGSGAAIGGFGFSKNFTLSPYLITTPQLSVVGFLDTPSQVSLYLNNLLIRQEDFSPGKFELLNLPVSASVGEATLVINDAYGQETTRRVSFQSSSKLLKPRLQEYSYHIGFKREHLAEHSFDYTDLVLIGSHRIGISDTFTAGLRAEADHDTINAGGIFTLLPTHRGQLDAALAGSYDEGRSGYATTASYMYLGGGHLSGNLTGRYFSPNYANLSLAAHEKNKSRLALSFSLTTQHRLLGSLAASWAMTDQYHANSEHTVMLSYNRTLWSNFSLNALAKRSETADGINHEYGVGVRFTPGRNRSGQIEYRNAKGASTTSVQFGKNPSGRFGYGYHAAFDAEKNPPDTWSNSGEASWQYYGRSGSYALKYRLDSEQQRSYELSAAGSLTWINHSWYLTPPLYESFALVNVGKLSGIPISLGGQEVAKTNRVGQALVVGLSAYISNLLSVDTTRLPFDCQLSDSKKMVAPAYKSGGIVTFDARKLQTFEGRFVMNADGAKMLAKYGWLAVVVAGETKEYVTGSEGEFYFEDISPGQYAAELFLENNKCSFTLNIPESAESTINLGDIDIYCKSE